MAVWTNGLPRHDTNKVARFPHGLMVFGETIEQCAQRLLLDQFGLQLVDVSVLEIGSHLDDQRHWHLEPLLLLSTSGEPKGPSGVEGFIWFDGPELPELSVWSPDWTRVWTSYLQQK